MHKKLQTELSQLLYEVGQLVQQGEREKAYRASLQATSVAPDDPRAWYLRSQVAPSTEEKLVCLSRTYSLDPSFSDSQGELRTALQTLLKQEPFLGYVYETETMYQVRSGRDLLINVPKNRAFETPYLKRTPGVAKPAFKWLSLAVLALILGGIGAVVFAPIAAFQALRFQAAAPSREDKVRLFIVLILAVIVWLAAIPISWLLLIRFYSL